MKNYIKISEGQFASVEIVEKKTDYDLDFLFREKERLEKELTEINNLIKEADKLKIKRVVM